MYHFSHFSVAVSTFIVDGSYYPIHLQNFFTFANESPHSLNNSPFPLLVPPFLAPGTTSLLSVSVRWTIPGTLHQWNI